MGEDEQKSTAVAEPLDMTTLISQKIRTMFIDMMPEDKFKALVESEIKKFTTDTKDYHNNPVPSPLKKLIIEALEEVSKERIKEALSEHIKRHGLNCPGEKLYNKKIFDLVPVVMESQVTKLSQQIVNELNQKLSSLGVY